MAWAEEARIRSLVRIGDSTEAVRDAMGDPKIAFPLRGQLVLDYGDYVVVSSNGVVVALKEKAMGDNAKAANAPSVQSVLARAQAGDAESQYCIAYCYHAGDPVARNMDKAVRWYTMAAMQGHMAAQHNLGVIYLLGDGVECDREQAYMWALLSADHGDDSLMLTVRPLITGKQEAAARLSADRIRNGQEEAPYGIPDASSVMARKAISGESPSSE